MPFGAKSKIDALNLKVAEVSQLLQAIDRSQAMIEFKPDGTILSANENFTNTVGYGLDEIVGQHHRMFVKPDYAGSAPYRQFWASLAAGEFIADVFERVDKQGRTIWLQASYNPVKDAEGRTIKVVKLAVDITAAEESKIAERAEQERVQAAQKQMASALADCLRRLSQRDLSARVELIDPMFEEIRTDYNHAMDELVTALSAIATATRALDSGARDISRASDDLARRTEQQAANLEETAAALDQITSTVASSSEGAAKVANAMSEAKTDATSSGQVVKSAVKAMGDIEESSHQISQIVTVIDEIAFQTNLLALNAGVEAARAGEAGRGFAVVASEVRSLAQRCADAAKEIKALISTTAGQVSQGVKLVGATGQALDRIVGRITEIDSLVVQIATSSKEQATSLSQVNIAVNQMDQVTQQNAAMVEEATAAVANLQTESAELARQVARFDVGAPPPKVALANPAQHRPAPNPVAAVQARLATAVGGGGAAAAAQQWDEF